MTITRENAIDMAWKTEGLEKIMQEKNDDQSKLLILAQLEVLMDLGMQKNPDQQRLESAYKVMSLFAERYNYDSGKRKYNSI